jgi:hypothetical protein
VKRSAKRGLIGQSETLRAMCRVHIRVLVLAVASIGCSHRDAATARVFVDSAGIRTVLLPQRTAGDMRLLNVAPQPSRAITGPVDSDGAPLARVRAAVRLTSGDIVVAHSGWRVDRFSAAGQWLQLLTHRDFRPGGVVEVDQLVLLPGDTLLAFDFEQRQLLWLLANGKTVRRVQLRHLSATSAIDFVGAFANGELLLRTATRFPANGSAPGVIVDSSTLLLADKEGRFRGVIGRVPAGEAFVETSSRYAHVAAPPLARGGITLVAGRCVVYGFNDRFRLTAWRPVSSDRDSISLDSHEDDDIRPIDVSPVLQIERSGGNVEVSKADKTELLRRLHREIVGKSQQWYFDALEQGSMRIPTTLPAFENVVRGADGKLWLADASHTDASKRRWTVLSAGWEVPAFVDLPSQLEILNVGRSEILGVVRGNRSDSIVVWPLTDSFATTASLPPQCR